MIALTSSDQTAIAVKKVRNMNTCTCADIHVCGLMVELRVRVVSRLITLASIR
jgi:hypothetical protein